MPDHPIFSCDLRVLKRLSSIAPTTEQVLPFLIRAIVKHSAQAALSSRATVVWCQRVPRAAMPWAFSSAAMARMLSPPM